MKPSFGPFVALVAWVGLGLAGCSSHQPPTNGAAPLATQPEPTSASDLPSPRMETSIAPAPEQATCGGKVCAEGTECIEYYGIAGKRGGLLHSCEIRCMSDAQCPTAKPKCLTLADGPGQVCR